MAEYRGKTITLDSPRVLVIYGDGEVTDVQTEHPDLALYDLERTRNKWPTIQDGPIWWLSYVAFSALRRKGQLREPKQRFEDWLLTTTGVKSLDENGEITEQVAQADPSLAGAAPA